MLSTYTRCGRNTARATGFPPPSRRPPWRSRWQVVVSMASRRTPPRPTMSCTSSSRQRTPSASRATDGCSTCASDEPTTACAPTTRLARLPTCSAGSRPSYGATWTR
eukprot:1908180-Pleurochrysis_carterae.AAC.1